MPTAPLEIVPCPPDRRLEAMSLVLCEIAPSQRRDIAETLESPLVRDQGTSDGLFVAMRGHMICGAAWAQPQPGNTAVVWPPQLSANEHEATALKLAQAVVRHLDDRQVVLSQVVLPSQDSQVVPVLSSIGFLHLADLLYLTCEAERFASHPPTNADVEFIAFDESQRSRLMALVERTYENTQDCAALNGTRRMEDVIDGYRATGVFRPENWLIVRGNGLDAGVLLLADHPAARHWELVYMGLVPEARGRGWGRQITQHAQALARAAKVERIVLAVDATNEPALRLYRAAGFESWDRRAVFVRFPAEARA